ncbi:MAG: response regulator transcription factor [Chloroflexota bacterium]
MEKTRVLLADDHSLVRAGLRLLLESEGDIEVVGEAADGFEAVAKAKELSPDVVLMDITMPKLNGLEAARQIQKRKLAVGILFVTMHQSQEFFLQALRAGASGYIPKCAQGAEMLVAVRVVRAGQTYVHPSVAKSLVSAYLEQPSCGEINDPYESLTDRERETLQLIAAGHTNQKAAELLHLSVNTIHNHRTSMMNKLGLHNRMELLKYAIRKGLITNEE